MREHDRIAAFVAQWQCVGLRKHAVSKITLAGVRMHYVVNENAVCDRAGGKGFNAPKPI